LGIHYLDQHLVLAARQVGQDDGVALAVIRPRGDAALWAKALVASSAPAAMAASVLARIFIFVLSDSVRGKRNQSSQTQRGRRLDEGVGRTFV
jgi:hypothetical protein